MTLQNTIRRLFRLEQDVDALSLGAGNMPSGGIAGQVPTKNSGTDYDADWANTFGKGVVVVAGVPSGGDDTTALQAAINAAGNDSAVYLPSGTWRTTGLTFNGSGGFNLIGSGRTDSYIRLDPSGDGAIGLRVYNSTPGQAINCRISNVGIFTTNTANHCTGLQLQDVGQCVLENVGITGFNGSGKDQVGLHTLGRQSLWVKNMRINANIPVRIGTNPNTTLGYLSADHFTFTGCYFTSVNAPDSLTWAIVLIDGTAHISQLKFNGGAWRMADDECYGLHWDMGYVDSETPGTDVHAYSSSLMLDSVRTESGASASTYSVYLNPTVNSELRNLKVINCEFDEFRHGIYARNVRLINIDSSILGHTSGKTLMNVDNYRAMHWAGVYTKASSGTLSVGSGNSIQWEVPETAVYDYPHTASWGS